VDGIPAGSHYHNLLKLAGTPIKALEMISDVSFSMQDQWQVQLQAGLQVKAEVHLYSECLTDEDIESAMFIPCRDIEKTVGELLARYGRDASICVLPEGPQTIPYIEG
jgi:nickel-dependent lactate racemase